MRRLLFVLLAFSLVCSAAAQNKVRHNVFLRSDTGEDTLWDGRIIRVYGLTSRLTEEPSIPAKTLYCREGDTVSLRTLNISQGEHHTVHLHGLDADTKNDGDPATSFSLGHMQDTDYTFYAAHAGTYLYHCHVADVVHVQMGMYGMLVVLPKDGSKRAWTDGPTFDKSYNWLFSEVDHTWHDNIPKHDSTADTVYLPIYNPDYFLTNGRSETSVTDDSSAILAKQGETVYLRLGAIGFFYQRVILPSWMNARRIDSDGRPLPAAMSGDTIELAPGERYGVLLDMTQATLDSVLVEHVSMNSDSVWGRQYVQVNSLQSSVQADKSEPALSVFPNPAERTATLNISLTGQSVIQARLYNILGREIRELYTGTINTDLKMDFETQDITTGQYFILISVDSKTYLLPFIVNR